MDQPGDVTQLLVEIRDSQRALVDEIRQIRAYFDNAQHFQKKLLRIGFPSFGLLFGAMILTTILTSGPSTYETWEGQNRQYQRHLDKADEYLDRTEKLQQRWEKQADRLDALLGKWEKAAKE